MVGAYSKCGWTKDLYKFRNISLSKNLKVLKITPNNWLALETLPLMCSEKFRELSMITLRSFFLSAF